MCDIIVWLHMIVMIHFFLKERKYPHIISTLIVCPLPLIVYNG